jgi:ubiquitin
MGTSTALDALLLVVLLSVAHRRLAGDVARARARAGPSAAAADDCPPPSASRLVPVGRQLELEARRGVHALELWLAGRARR